jgi:hypothetical protein
MTVAKRIGNERSMFAESTEMAAACKEPMQPRGGFTCRSEDYVSDDFNSSISGPPD